MAAGGGRHQPPPEEEGVTMATCNLCPPGRRDIPDGEIDEHRRTAHPEVAADGTRKTDGSRIVADSATDDHAQD
ncbi:hypothetical protein FHX34_106300 [Actinoplanes teichomyceticus]|uniref:Uncharacterized protein n=2 Tax=Actinoplanes teichomyceticus TaxID=1867 RepID=A0A561VIX4_ACTTI|nr:hypothetical protein FHX34_106300 [Actinoplanes teichomyceticus]